MSILKHFLPYFLLYLTTIIGLVLIGFTYLRFTFSWFFKDKENVFFVTLALALSAGLIIVISFTAVYFTNFKTIFLWSFLFLLFPFLKLKKANYLPLKSILIGFKTSNILFLLVLLFLVFIYHGYIFYNPTHAPFFDFLYYGKVSSGLLQDGVESFNVFNNDYFKAKNPSLYHYSELWANGLISKISGLPEIYTLFYVVYPLLHFVVFILCVVIVSKQTQCKPIFYVIGAFILLYGIKLFLPLEKTKLFALIDSGRGLPQTPYSFKLLPIYFLGLLGILFYTHKNTRIAFIVFSFIPIFYASTIPSFAGIGFGLLFISLINKNQKFQYWNIVWFEPLILLLSILFILTYKSVYNFDFFVKLPLMTYPIKMYFVFSAHTFLTVFTEHFIVLIALIVVLIKFGKQLVFRPLILIPLFGIFAVNLFLIIHDESIPDIDQTLTNISPFFVLMIAIELIPFFKNKAWKMALPILLLFGIFNLSFFKLYSKYTYDLQGRQYTHSTKFINNVNQYINRYKGKFTHCTVRENFMDVFKKQPWLARWSYDCSSDFHFSLVNKNVRPSIEIGQLFEKDFPEYCLSNEIMKNVILINYPPCEFFKNKPLTNANILLFLKENKVNHLYIENHKTLPVDFIKNCTLLFQDEPTGTSLWSIN